MSNADPKRLAGIVSPEVIAALMLADKALTDAGIPHLAIGGLAVCAYGYRRTTDDVDFLVGDSAFEHHGPIVSLRVPIATVGPVRVDQVSFPFDDEPALNDELVASYKPGKLGQIAPLRMLVVLKLKANRLKDTTDVVELIKRGAFDDDEFAAIAAYLADRPELAKRWTCAVARATRETDTP